MFTRLYILCLLYFACLYSCSASSQSPITEYKYLSYTNNIYSTYTNDYYFTNTEYKYYTNNYYYTNNDFKLYFLKSHSDYSYILINNNYAFHFRSTKYTNDLTQLKYSGMVNTTNSNYLYDYDNYRLFYKTKHSQILLNHYFIYK